MEYFQEKLMLCRHSCVIQSLQWRQVCYKLVGDLRVHQLVVGTTGRAALGLPIMNPEPHHRCVVFFTYRHETKWDTEALKQRSLHTWYNFEKCITVDQDQKHETHGWAISYFFQKNLTPGDVNLVTHFSRFEIMHSTTDVPPDWVE